MSIYSRSSPSDKARLSSLRLPHSGTWLRVCPTSVASKLSNLQFSIAAKQRLGINLVTPLPVVCPCCEGDASLRDDATHLLGCPNLSRTALTRRHDAVVAHLAAWCNSVKMPAFVEPKINGQRRRPDVDIVMNQGRVLVDVSFVHPSSATYVRHHNAMTSAVSPLHAREQVKTSKYGRLAQEAQAELVPFVVSSFGGFGGAAMRFLAKLREAVAAMDPVPWSNDPVGDLVRELCVLAQRGNASAVIMGCNRAGILLRHQRPVGLAVEAEAQQLAQEHPELEDV